MKNWWKSQKNQNLQMTLKCDLDVVYTCYRHENTSKESQEYISDNFWCARPLPADSGHILHQQKSKKSRKITKNYIFRKSIFCSILLENMIFEAKSLSGPYECTRKNRVYKKLQGITTRNDKNILRPDSESWECALSKYVNHLSDSLT